LLLEGKRTLNEALKQTLRPGVVKLISGSSIRLRKMSDGIMEELAPSKQKKSLLTAYMSAL
jgi:hypothetical protein